jgi:hypothetical protein
MSASNSSFDRRLDDCGLVGHRLQDVPAAGKTSKRTVSRDSGIDCERIETRAMTALPTNISRFHHGQKDRMIFEVCTID